MASVYFKNVYITTPKVYISIKVTILQAKAAFAAYTLFKIYKLLSYTSLFPQDMIQDMYNMH